MGDTLWGKRCHFVFITILITKLLNSRYLSFLAYGWRCFFQNIKCLHMFASPSSTNCGECGFDSWHWFWSAASVDHQLGARKSLEGRTERSWWPRSSSFDDPPDGRSAEMAGVAAWGAWQLGSRSCLSAKTLGVCLCGRMQISAAPACGHRHYPVAHVNFKWAPCCTGERFFHFLGFWFCFCFCFTCESEWIKLPAAKDARNMGGLLTPLQGAGGIPLSGIFIYISFTFPPTAS